MTTVHSSEVANARFAVGLLQGEDEEYKFSREIETYMTDGPLADASTGHKRHRWRQTGREISLSKGFHISRILGRSKGSKIEIQGLEIIHHRESCNSNVDYFYEVLDKLGQQMAAKQQCRGAFTKEPLLSSICIGH